MILIDTSAWVDFLRGSNSEATSRVAALALEPDRWATTEPVVMELEAGADRDDVLEQVRGLLRSVPILSVRPESDFTDAAALYRATRRSGLTVRALSDCLIAAVALRTRSTVVHKDADFAAIAAVCPLDHEDLRGQ